MVSLEDVTIGMTFG